MTESDGPERYRRSRHDEIRDHVGGGGGGGQERTKKEKDGEMWKEKGELETLMELVAENERERDIEKKRERQD